MQREEVRSLVRLIRFRAKTPTLRSPIHSGSADQAVAADAVAARGTLRVLAPAPAHILACFPSAGAAVVAAVRADMGSGSVPRCDGPVAAEDVVVDDMDMRSAGAATWGIVQVCSDSTRSRYLQVQAGQGQGDLCWHAH